MKKFTNNDFEKMDKRERANLMNQLSGYKSPGLIGTKNSDGVENVAVFSNIFHLGSDPSLIGIFFRPPTVERHSFENILETGFASLNYLDSSFYKKVHLTSSRYERNESEFRALGLSPTYYENSFAPFVQEAHLSLDLKLRERVDIEINGTVILALEILNIYFKEEMKIPNLCSLGLDQYFKTSFLDKLAYAKKELS